MLHVAREDSGLQAVARVVGLCESVIEIIKRLDRGDWSEDLFRADAHLAVNVCQHSRVKKRTASLSSTEQARARRHSFINPTLCSSRGLFRYHHGKLCRFIQWVARSQTFHAFDEARSPIIGDAFV